MKIILISSRADKVRTISLNSWAKGLLSVLLLGIPVAAGTMLGVKIADGRWELLFDNSIGEMQHQLVVQQSHVDAGREQLDSSLAAMTRRTRRTRHRAPPLPPPFRPLQKARAVKRVPTRVQPRARLARRRLATNRAPPRRASHRPRARSSRAQHRHEISLRPFERLGVARDRRRERARRVVVVRASGVCNHNRRLTVWP